MSEIPSAEELALKIERISQMRCENPDCEVCAEHKKEAADLIRARDKAIVELCRGAIRKTIDAYFGMGSGVCKDCELAFDDVLRELGGEQ